ncbi:MAG: hypothetical protein IT165_32350 [Bryobacterales bacterium]|nr:hypothetical protein [Bryobacterales bacterium]
MPLRIMSWNIERFGINKFLNNTWDTTGARQLHVTNNIAYANPDILVIQEVQTNAHGGFGGLISDTSGGPALMALLTYLQNAPAHAADNWFCVPPLIISQGGGYSEGIGVLFKGARFTFQGPWKWTGANAVDLNNITAQAAYGGLWAGALPNNDSGVADPLGGPNFTEDELAGQYVFDDALGAQINFPNGTSRSLWHTQFLDNNTGRTLGIFAVHFPPKAYQARLATARLASVQEVGAALGATEDRVILGDFNVNFNNAAQVNAFQHLTGGPAALAAEPVCPIVYALQFAAALGQATSLKSVKQSSTTGAANFYNYVQQDSAGNFLGLDNILVARGGAVLAAGNPTVVNRVLGAPPQLDMAQSVPNMILNIAPGGPRAKRFRTLVNYGHIGGKIGASDHMAIYSILP